MNMHVNKFTTSRNILFKQSLCMWQLVKLVPHNKHANLFTFTFPTWFAHSFDPPLSKRERFSIPPKKENGRISLGFRFLFHNFANWNHNHRFSGFDSRNRANCILFQFFIFYIFEKNDRITTWFISRCLNYNVSLYS